MKWLLIGICAIIGCGHAEWIDTYGVESSPSAMTKIHGPSSSKMWIHVDTNGMGSRVKDRHCWQWYWQVNLLGTEGLVKAWVYADGHLIHEQDEMHAEFHTCGIGSGRSRRTPYDATLYIIAPDAASLRFVVQDVLGNQFEYVQDLALLAERKAKTIQFLTRGRH